VFERDDFQLEPDQEGEKEQTDLPNYSEHLKRLGWEQLSGKGSEHGRPEENPGDDLADHPGLAHAGKEPAHDARYEKYQSDPE
jgi:hypothetical protein